MAFSSQLEHAVYQQHSEQKWSCVDQEDMPVVLELEAEAEKVSVEMPGSVWACSLCLEWDGRGKEVVAHLNEQ